MSNSVLNNIVSQLEAVISNSKNWTELNKFIISEGIKSFSTLKTQFDSELNETKKQFADDELKCNQKYADDLQKIESHFANERSRIESENNKTYEFQRQIVRSILGLKFDVKLKKTAFHDEVEELINLSKVETSDFLENVNLFEAFKDLERDSADIQSTLYEVVQKGKLGKDTKNYEYLTTFTFSFSVATFFIVGILATILDAAYGNNGFVNFLLVIVMISMFTGFGAIVMWIIPRNGAISLKRLTDYELLKQKIETFAVKTQTLKVKSNERLHVIPNDLQNKKTDLTFAFNNNMTTIGHKHKQAVLAVQQKAADASQVTQESWGLAAANERQKFETLNGVNLKNISTVTATIAPNWHSPDFIHRERHLIRLGELLLVPKQLISTGNTFDSSAHKIPEIYQQLEETDNFIKTICETNANKYIPLTLTGDGGWNLFIPSIDNAALEAVQSLCLQQLANHKPGNVRFKFVDAVALGHWAAPFLQISDTQPNIVGPKAWTSVRDIDQVIAEIRNEIEAFVQKRLGNKFTSIVDHNAHVQSSGKGFEEPYRVLVFFGIPQDLPKSTCDSLLALMRTGARCGVRVIIAADSNKLPRDLPFQELYNLSGAIVPGPISVTPLSGDQVNLNWSSTVSDTWGYTVYPYYCFDLKLDRLPSPDVISRILKDVDQNLAEQSKVKVSVNSWFTTDKFQSWRSDEGLKLFLGETSDGKERYLEIGKDGSTNHHAFIVGQTGSGKGVLLRTMVMSGAWTYSPDELQFYLLDLKEGVGFKPFVTDPLPHNRVIALKGEREMGVAILRHLSTEMEKRGKLFRQVDAENISQYRAKTGKSMPRLVLVIDEFQKMFEDQGLATQASSLLEGFAREGRAFGIHLVLVTQDLGGLGSYIKQVQTQSGIRIALQCSQDVAAVVLNPHNTLAVRNLTRAGEAIYNDRAGDEAGNTPFQVAFLDPDKLPDLSRQIAKADARKNKPHTYVFNGNETPSIESSTRMVGLIQQPYLKARPKGKDGIRLVVGASVDLKPASEAILQRVPGKNLLICGSSEEQALQTLTSSLLGLAAQHTPDTNPAGAKFVIVDFLGESTEHPDWFNALSAIPHSCEIYRAKDLTKVVDDIYKAVDGETTPSSQRSTIYWVLYGLHRARDLRDNKGSVDNINQLFKNGPEEGLHTLLWVDRMDALFSRDVLKSFDLRAVLTGNEAEIQTLVPSSKSFRIGTSAHLGILVDTETGLVEKYRPLSLPS